MKDLEYFRAHQEEAPEWAVNPIEPGDKHRYDMNADFWKEEGQDFLLKGNASLAIIFKNQESLVFWGGSIRISANRRQLTIDGESFEIPMLKSQQSDMKMDGAPSLKTVPGYHPFGACIRRSTSITPLETKQVCMVFFNPARKIPLEKYSSMTEKERLDFKEASARAAEPDHADEMGEPPRTPGSP